jgi:hypothetical protein
MPRQRLREQLRHIPENTDFLVLHQMLYGIVPTWDLRIEELPDYVPVTLLGDCHLPLEFDTPGGKAYYNGSLVPQRITELDTSGSFMVVEDTGTIRRERVPIREMRRYNAANLEDLTLVHHLISDQVGKDESRFNPHLPPLVFITYEIRAKDIHQELEALCSTFDGIIFELIPYSGKGTEDPELPTISGEDMSSYVAEYTKDPALQALLCGLLETGDRAPIDNYRKHVYGSC